MRGFPVAVAHATPARARARPPLMKHVRLFRNLNIRRSGSQALPCDHGQHRDIPALAQIVGSQQEKDSAADALPPDYDIKADLVGSLQDIASNTEKYRGQAPNSRTGPTQSMVN